MVLRNYSWTPNNSHHFLCLTYCLPPPRQTPIRYCWGKAPIVHPECSRAFDYLFCIILTPLCVPAHVCLSYTRRFICSGSPKIINTPDCAMLLLIDNYDSFTYNLVHYLGELGADVVVKRNDALNVQEAMAMRPEAIVLSPGPCDPSQAGICLALVHAAV